MVDFDESCRCEKTKKPKYGGRVFWFALFEPTAPDHIECLAVVTHDASKLYPWIKEVFDGDPDDFLARVVFGTIQLTEDPELWPLKLRGELTLMGADKIKIKFQEGML